MYIHKIVKESLAIPKNKSAQYIKNHFLYGY